MHVAQFAAPVRRQQPQTPQNAQQAHTLLAPSDEIRDFVLAANVAAQDATQDPAASAAPERVVTQLAGSAESATYLFALCEAPPLGEVSELSYPLISSTDNPRECGIRGHAWPGGEPNFVGFIHLTLPLLEDTSIAEIECVLDIDLLPLPGESADDKTKQVTARLLASAEHIAAQLGRSRAQITVHHPADCPPDADPFYPATIDSGYHRHLGHIQAYIRAEHAMEQTHIARQQAHSGAENHPGYRLLAWRDYAIADEYAPQIRQLLTVASIDVPSGGMDADPYGASCPAIARSRWLDFVVRTRRQADRQDLCLDRNCAALWLRPNSSGMDADRDRPHATSARLSKPREIRSYPRCARNLAEREPDLRIHPRSARTYALTLSQPWCRRAQLQLDMGKTTSLRRDSRRLVVRT